MDNQKNAMKSKKGKMSGKTTFSSSAWVKPTQNALKEENAPARMTNLSSAKVGLL